MFPDEGAGREWFGGGGGIWPDGRRCPRRGYGYTCVAERPKMPHWRFERKKHFGAKIGAATGHSKISYRKWAVDTYLLATRPKGVFGVQSGRDMGTAGLGAALAVQDQGPWRTLAGPGL